MLHGCQEPRNQKKEKIDELTAGQYLWVIERLVTQLQMSRANPLWGAPRIHGELLKLGIEVSQATVAKYMVRRVGRPSPTWRSFLRNQAAGILLLPRVSSTTIVAVRTKVLSSAKGGIIDGRNMPFINHLDLTRQYVVVAARD